MYRLLGLCVLSFAALCPAIGQTWGGPLFPPVIRDSYNPFYSGPELRLGPGLNPRSVRSQYEESAPLGYPVNVVPKGDEAFNVEATKEGKLQISWVGRTEFVSGAYVAFLDKGKKELTRHRFESLPISLSTETPKDTKYYRLVMTYVNGTVTTFTAPLPATPVEEKKEEKPKPKDTTGLGGP